MTDEGHTELSIVEAKRGLENVAELTYHFFEQLVQKGFSETQALSLTATWLATSVSQSQSQE